MKKFRSLLALLLVLMLALPVYSLAEEDAAPETEEALAEDPVLVTIDGEEYRKSYIDSIIYKLMYNNSLYDDRDYYTAIEYLVQDEVVTGKITEWELDKFTDEENEAFRNEAQDEWDLAIDKYADYYTADDSPEARAAAREQGIAYYEALGYSVDMLAEVLRVNAAYDRLMEKMRENVLDEEIRQVFEQYAEEDKARYEGNIPMYELYMDYGEVSWYMPEGYRGVLYILLDSDEELLTALQDAQIAYEESTSGEDVEGDNKELKAALDAAEAAVLADRQDAIDEIYARLEAGESFESLIAQYSADPIVDEELLRDGLSIHRDTVASLDPAFLSAAFGEQLLKPGDISAPAVGIYGIYIVKYVRDVPGGYVELTDEISDLIANYLSNQKIYDSLEAWTAEHEIIYNEEAIKAAINGGSVLEEAE